MSRADNTSDRSSVVPIAHPTMRLLKDVSTHELRLVCDRACADQKLQIHLKTRPVRTLMHALAELLPGTWAPLPNHAGYLLTMSSQAVVDRDRWWQVFLDARHQEIETMAQDLLSVLRHPQHIDFQGTISPETASPKDVQGFYSALPADLQDRIAYNVIDNGPFGLAENGSSGDGVRFGDPGAIVIPLSGLPQSARDVIIRNSPTAAQIPVLISAVQVIFHTYPDSVEADFQRSDGTIAFSSMNVDGSMSSQQALLGLAHTTLPDKVRSLGHSALPEWKLLADYQARRIWKNILLRNTLQENAPPANLPGVIGDRFSGSKPPRSHRSDELRRLAQQADLEFVADYYSLGRAPVDTTRPVKGEVDHELNRIASEQDSSWKREQGVVLFRDNRWYRDDQLEVPSKLAQPLLALPPIDKTDLKSPQSLQAHLDRMLSLTSQLSRWQIANGLAGLAHEP